MTRLWGRTDAPAPAAGSAPGLAARQAALVAALVADGPAPPGFDAGRLAAARAALLRKRAREAAKLWPLLAAAPDWPGVFAAHRDGHEPVGPLRDGWEVARALRARGELGPGGAAELDDREAALHYDGLRDPRRRSAAGRFAARFRGRR